jgi:hypothetical protein
MVQLGFLFDANLRWLVVQPNKKNLSPKQRLLHRGVFSMSPVLFQLAMLHGAQPLIINAVVGAPFASVLSPAVQATHRFFEAAPVSVMASTGTNDTSSAANTAQGRHPSNMF